jgi:hypothetical protein
MTHRHDYTALARRMRHLGFTVETTGGGHLRWIAPNGAVTFSGSTPSCCHALGNLRARLRRVIRQGHQQGELLGLDTASI